MSNTIQKRLLTLREAADYLAMTNAALYQLVHRKRVPVVRLGRALRFDIQALNAWIDEHKEPARKPAA